MQIALFFIMLAASALTICWIIMLITSGEEEKTLAANALIFSSFLKSQEWRRRKKEKDYKLREYSGILYVFFKIVYGTNGSKKIAKLDKLCAELQAGEKRYTGFISLPGLAIMKKSRKISDSHFFKILLSRCVEQYGRHSAVVRAEYLFGTAVSISIIGVGIALAVGAILIAADLTMQGATLAGIGSLVVLLAAYSGIDAERAKAIRRREEIARQFPNVVSKLALLVCSGMIMARAWRETSRSAEGAIYAEMRRTSEELDQNIAPEAAYSAFISRCNTKETSKLASAILQNMSRGNAQVGELFRSMAKEAWLERRHNAKRDAEKANSKLMIPTMLLFISILILIMVPLAMSMGGAI